MDPNPVAGQQRLAFHEFAGNSDFASTLAFRATGGAALNLHIQVGFSDHEDAVFPSLTADFSLAWEFNAAPNDLSGGVPVVAFNNVGLNLGRYFSKFVKPIFDTVKTVLTPILPIIEVLETRMPVFSDIDLLRGLYDENIDGQVDLLEIVVAFAPIDPAKKELIFLVRKFLDIAERIPDGSNDVVIPLV